MDAIRKLPPAFLPLIAAYPILFIAGANPGQAQISTVALLAAVAVAATLVAWLLLRPLASSSASAAVAVGFLVLTFFTYGKFGAWLDSFASSLRLGDFETPNVLDLVPKSRSYVAMAWGAISVLVSLLVARSQWAGKRELAKALAVAATVLVVITIVQIAAGAIGRSHGGAQSSPLPSANSANRARGPARDIVFVVLDGYARQDVLARYYDFDNGAFLGQLRSRGLQVATQSSANYAWTFLSLVSTLNMRYVHDEFQGRLGPNSLDRSVIYDAIRDNETARFLRSMGYQIVHIRSTWGATSVNPYADREIRCESSVFANEFVRAVAEASWLGSFHTKAGFDLARCNLANFDALRSIKAGGPPKFVFAHFVLPHHPYLFDRDGRILRNAVVSNQFEFQKQLWEDRGSYREQLEFVNRKVLEAVDALVARPGPAPIIVIVSDHGPGLVRNQSEQSHYAIRFANLGAYYLPGAPPDLMPVDGTAINQFRRILGYYFGANLPPLPDRHFASPNALPYLFREVPHETLQQWWTAMESSTEPAASSIQSTHNLEPIDE